MTLVLTEITHHGIVFATDRNILKWDPAPAEQTLLGRAQKLFPVPNLEAGICYYGLAQIGGILMGQWLPTFIQTANRISSLRDFAFRLAETLNKASLLTNEKGMPLGFHLAGYVKVRNLRVPSFWHIRNIYQMTPEAEYVDIREEFQVSEDFLERDVKDVAPAQLEKHLVTTGYIYRNGMLRPYVDLAKLLYTFFPKIWEMEGFSTPKSLLERARYLEFHIELLNRIYTRFYKGPAPVGGGIDLLAISKRGFALV